MHPIFDRVNMSNLKIIGSGAFNICFSDGKYAIKIGSTSVYAVADMQAAYESGFGIEVIAVAYNAEIPQTMLSMIQLAQDVMSYGKKGFAWPVNNYIRNGMYADVLITELVKPCMSHKKKYSEVYENRMYTRAEKLAKAYHEKTGNMWHDTHPWNMGITKDHRLVILDM